MKLEYLKEIFCLCLYEGGNTLFEKEYFPRKLENQLLNDVFDFSINWSNCESIKILLENFPGQGKCPFCTFLRGPPLSRVHFVLDTKTLGIFWGGGKLRQNRGRRVPGMFLVFVVFIILKIFLQFSQTCDETKRSSRSCLNSNIPCPPWQIYTHEKLSRKKDQTYPMCSFTK